MCIEEVVTLFFVSWWSSRFLLPPFGLGCIKHMWNKHWWIQHSLSCPPPTLSCDFLYFFCVSIFLCLTFLIHMTLLWMVWTHNHNRHCHNMGTQQIASQHGASDNCLPTLSSRSPIYNFLFYFLFLRICLLSLLTPLPITFFSMTSVVLQIAAWLSFGLASRIHI